MKVLLADDDPVSRSMLEAALLTWGYEVLAVPDGVTAWKALQEPNGPKLAVLDWIMPGLDGPEICRKLRRQPREDYVYIIVLTVKGEKEDVVDGLNAGADDYLTKPFDPHELEARLRAGKRILDLQAELLATREALHFRATHDHLTGLWNRSAILDILRRELARAGREETSVGVVMADVDHFKQINDTYAHAAGDAVLCEVANRTTARGRPYDSVGRYGGDELLIILPGCDGPKAAKVADRLRQCICVEPVLTPEGTIATTLSLGVATTGPGETLDANTLVGLADAALYRAKSAGRNRVELATTADVAQPEGASIEEPEQAGGEVRAEGASEPSPAEH